MTTRCFAIYGAIVLFMGRALVGQTIDFASDDTLKAVFASGLQPWRYDGSLDRCEIGPGQVALVLPGGRKISTFPVESGSFRVFGNYEITESDFASGLLSVNDAVALTKQIANELGISPEGIDSLAAQAKPASITSPRFWSGKVSSGKFTVSVQFTPIPRFNEVKATVDLRLNWERPLKGRRYWTEPMPPPPGYENVGFGTPPPPQGPQNPNPGPEYYEALLLAQKGERPKPGVTPAATAVSKTTTTRPSPSATTTPNGATEKPAAPGFPVVPAAILAAAIVAFVVFLLRRKSP